jgi:Ca-activated chloride channel family protein
MNVDWNNNQTRMEAAKEVLVQEVEKLRGIPNLEIALRVYGHQTPITNTYQDCNDTKLEVPFGVNTVDAIKSKVKSLQAKGSTPIARSLEAAAGDFPDTLARNYIILITDGLESCDNDPCIIARKLKDKGVKVTPFVIGLGMDLSYLDKFDCIGAYSDAESKESFRNVLSSILSKTLVNTTVQVNLNDITKKPLETNVTLFFYESGTTNLKYTFTHTLNRKNLPDTLILDPNLTYDLVVNTLPKVGKKGIVLQKHTHNTIIVDAPQGYLKFTASRNTQNPTFQMRVSMKNDPQTLHAQNLNSTQKYLVGIYDLEIFTLPRTYLNVEITQSKTTIVDVIPAGTFQYAIEKAIVGQIFFERKPDQWEWVANLDENLLEGKWDLQPGNYKVVYREKAQKSSAYTKEKKFRIDSNKTLLLNL